MQAIRAAERIETLWLETKPTTPTTEHGYTQAWETFVKGGDPLDSALADTDRYRCEKRKQSSSTLPSPSKGGPTAEEVLHEAAERLAALDAAKAAEASKQDSNIQATLDARRAAKQNKHGSVSPTKEKKKKRDEDTSGDATPLLPPLEVPVHLDPFGPPDTIVSSPTTTTTGRSQAAAASGGTSPQKQQALRQHFPRPQWFAAVTSPAGADYSIVYLTVPTLSDVARGAWDSSIDVELALSNLYTCAAQIRRGQDEEEAAAMYSHKALRYRFSPIMAAALREQMNNPNPTTTNGVGGALPATAELAQWIEFTLVLVGYYIQQRDLSHAKHCLEVTEAVMRAVPGSRRLSAPTGPDAPAGGDTSTEHVTELPLPPSDTTTPQTTTAGEPRVMGLPLMSLSRHRRPAGLHHLPTGPEGNEVQPSQRQG